METDKAWKNKPNHNDLGSTCLNDYEFKIKFNNRLEHSR